MRIRMKSYWFNQCTITTTSGLERDIPEGYYNVAEDDMFPNVEISFGSRVLSISKSQFNLMKLNSTVKLNLN